MGVQRRFFCAGACMTSCEREEQPGFSHLPGGKKEGKQASRVTQEKLPFLLYVEPTVKMSAGLWSKRQDLFLFTCVIHRKEVLPGASNRNQSGGESVVLFLFQTLR